jgi:hypothetical protein
MIQVFQVIFSALLLTFSAWLSKKNPQAAGFLIALPLATIIVLPFSYWNHGESETSVRLAQEILRAIPISLTFFLPFALAGRLNLTFWQAYGFGLILLVATYFVLKAVTSP